MKNLTKKPAEKPKLLVILGPTSTGKSDLAVSLARLHNGEIISADSRQVYTGLDIATGKISTKEMSGVPHHLLDIASPRHQFSVAEWQILAHQKITEIIARGHLPIICGGTGFYIQSVVDNITLPFVVADKVLRKNLGLKSAEELFAILKKLDPERAKEIDPHNSIRMIRAIEIAKTLGHVPPLKKSTLYNTLQIGLTASTDILREKIETRLNARFEAGMITETIDLHAHGLSYKRMRELGLEYRHLADFLQKRISEDQLYANILADNINYTKCQMTWFKRDKRIVWFDISKQYNKKEYNEKILDLVQKFLA